MRSYKFYNTGSVVNNIKFLTDLHVMWFIIIFSYWYRKQNRSFGRSSPPWYKRYVNDYRKQLVGSYDSVLWWANKCVCRYSATLNEPLSRNRLQTRVMIYPSSLFINSYYSKQRKKNKEFCTPISMVHILLCHIDQWNSYHAEWRNAIYLYIFSILYYGNYGFYFLLLI